MWCWPRPHIFVNVPAVLAKVFSGAVYGGDAFEVEIEVNASSGNPVIVMFGTNPPECI
jgi:hypothetical protein